MNKNFTRSRDPFSSTPEFYDKYIMLFTQTKYDNYAISTKISKLNKNASNPLYCTFNVIIKISIFELKNYTKLTVVKPNFFKEDMYNNKYLPNIDNVEPMKYGNNLTIISYDKSEIKDFDAVKENKKNFKEVYVNLDLDNTDQFIKI